MALVDQKSNSFAKTNMKVFRNCIRLPIVHSPPRAIVLNVITPNPLHMKLRVTNTLVGHMDVAVHDVSEQYLTEIGVIKERYHGEFEGRPCSKIARGYKVLRSIISAACEQQVEAQHVLITSSGQHKKRRVSGRRTETTLKDLVAHHPASAFADAFQALDGIMNCCYGAQFIEPLSHSFTDFRRAVNTLGCSVTQSMHMLGDHTMWFCKKNGCRLLAFSEETAESLHSECKSKLRDWKVPPPGQQKHQEFLIRMVSGINAAHAFSR